MEGAAGLKGVGFYCRFKNAVEKVKHVQQIRSSFDDLSR
jgi:hypothetical protein